MDGKDTGPVMPIDDRPIPFLLHEPTPKEWIRLVQGFEKMELPFELVRADKEWKVVPGGVCIASGIKAAEIARETGFKEVFTVPSLDLWAPEHKAYPGLGKLVADDLRRIAKIRANRALPTSSSTSASIPTTSGKSTPSTDPEDVNAPFLNPREAGLPFPTDTLTMEEIRSLFTGKYSQDKPFIFSSGGAEVAIYPDDAPGNRPIEFSLDEFYTIMKLIEITKADGIIWREKEDADPK
jgi:hypothetical protein